MSSDPHESQESATSGADDPPQQNGGTNPSDGHESSAGTAGTDDSPPRTSKSSGAATAIDVAGRVCVAVWMFIRRQKLPEFLKFYRDHWRDVSTYIGDGFSAPADSELWIRASDPSPGLYREQGDWEIDASPHCVICGAIRETQRRRLKTVVRDFDGMIYGVLAALLLGVVLYFATGSWLISVAGIFVGLWGARRLVVEEPVRIHCSTCGKHEGEEQSLHLRLKRETLIIELGSHKARLNFLRKSREAAAGNAWAPPPPPPSAFESADVDVPPTTSADPDSSTDTDGSIPSPVEEPHAEVIDEPARIPLAGSDDSEDNEIRPFALHAADGPSVDAPLTPNHEADRGQVDHYFDPEPRANGPLLENEPSLKPAVPSDNPPGADSVLIPPDNADAETFSLAAPSPSDPDSNDEWYCRIDGVEVGPLPLRQAQNLKSSGTLKPNDEVRQGLASEWTTPDSLPAASPSPVEKKESEEPTDTRDPWSAADDDSDRLWDPWSE